MTATTSHLTEPGPPVTLCPSSDQPLEQRERQWLWARGLALRPGSASSLKAACASVLPCAKG